MSVWSGRNLEGAAARQAARHCQDQRQTSRQPPRVANSHGGQRSANYGAFRYPGAGAHCTDEAEPAGESVPTGKPRSTNSAIDPRGNAHSTRRQR